MTSDNIRRTRIKQVILSVLIAIQVGCSSDSDWENDSFSITAKLNTDGTCSFSVDKLEVGVKSKYVWYDYKKKYDLTSEVNTSVLCKPHKDSTTTVPHRPRLYLQVKAPLHGIDIITLSGVDYDLVGSEEVNSMQFSQGVFLTIGGLSKFEKWSLIYCGVDIVSIEGTAVLRSTSRNFGPISLEIVGRGRRQFSGC